MNNQNWDKYVNAYNELANELIKAGFDTMKLKIVITLHEEYILSVSKR